MAGKYDCEKCPFDSVWVTNTDLADVVSDPAVVDDVQSIFDRVVVALGPLEGLFVTQLNVQNKNQVQHRQIYTMLPHFSFIIVYEGSIASSLSISIINSTHKTLNTIIIYYSYEWEARLTYIAGLEVGFLCTDQ